MRRKPSPNPNQQPDPAAAQQLTQSGPNLLFPLFSRSPVLHFGPVPPRARPRRPRSPLPARPLPLSQQRGPRHTLVQLTRVAHASAPTAVPRARPLFHSPLAHRPFPDDVTWTRPVSPTHAALHHGPFPFPHRPSNHLGPAPRSPEAQPAPLAHSAHSARALLLLTPRPRWSAPSSPLPPHALTSHAEITAVISGDSLP
jgi:hypothetical protein